jgi:hypothetical protein
MVADATLRALAEALVPYLRELAAFDSGTTELVEVATAVPLPRRVVHRACRHGEIRGAAKTRADGSQRVAPSTLGFAIASSPRRRTTTTSLMLYA